MDQPQAFLFYFLIFNSCNGELVIPNQIVKLNSGVTSKYVYQQMWVFVLFTSWKTDNNQIYNHFILLAYSSSAKAHLLNISSRPWPDDSFGWNTIPCTKRLQFNPWLGHIPTSQVQSPVGACTVGNRSVLFSLPLSLSFSVKSIKTYPRVRNE